MMGGDNLCSGGAMFNTLSDKLHTFVVLIIESVPRQSMVTIPNRSEIGNAMFREIASEGGICAQSVEAIKSVSPSSEITEL